MGLEDGADERVEKELAELGMLDGRAFKVDGFAEIGGGGEKQGGGGSEARKELMKAVSSVVTVSLSIWRESPERAGRGLEDDRRRKKEGRGGWRVRGSRRWWGEEVWNMEWVGMDLESWLSREGENNVSTYLSNTRLIVGR